MTDAKWGRDEWSELLLLSLVFMLWGGFWYCVGAIEAGAHRCDTAVLDAERRIATDPTRTMPLTDAQYRDIDNGRTR
jgi:hypothetical protein